MEPLIHASLRSPRGASNPSAFGRKRKDDQSPRGLVDLAPFFAFVWSLKEDHAPAGRCWNWTQEGRGQMAPAVAVGEEIFQANTESWAYWWSASWRIVASGQRTEGTSPKRKTGTPNANRIPDGQEHSPQTSAAGECPEAQAAQLCRRAVAFRPRPSRQTGRPS
jgi:hypothetical protein